jgi:hypothetical protein
VSILLTGYSLFDLGFVACHRIADYALMAMAGLLTTVWKKRGAR